MMRDYIKLFLYSN